MTDSVASVLNQAEELRSISDSWKLDAELLLADAIGCDRATLLAHGERILDEEQMERYRKGVARRQKGEPIAYIVGKKDFWDFQLTVDQRVLIPRPETELLVERALAILKDCKEEPLQLADLGTGSGAIAIALARASNNWQVTATDISVDALMLAQSNGESWQLNNIHFQQSYWCQNLEATEFDLIVSNPPYVDPSDPHLQEDGLMFEPEIALVAQDNGLAEIRQIIQQSPGFLKKDAWILLEHGNDQAEAVCSLFSQNGFREITCWQDLAGLDRVTGARKPIEAEPHHG